MESVQEDHILLVWLPLIHPKTFKVLFLLSPPLNVPVDVPQRFDLAPGSGGFGDEEA